MNLVELYDIVIQAQSLNGVPLSNGHVYVYALGRTRLMDTWSDVAGESLNTNPVILDNAGQAKIYVSDAFDYTLVFTDEYDNEIFSVDKYLLSQGAHSHADVAVAPSESIAVSSYNVGEVTVYVPYLTGQLGKVYTGIDPIVVNNTEDKISANHVPLGVQDPLYFVQDDEEGCIIGCSAQTEIPSAISGKWDAASDAVITNSAQWAENTEYEEGNYISIDNNVINVTGLSPVPTDTASTGLVAEVSADIVSQIPSTAGLATESWVEGKNYATVSQLDNKLDKADSAKFYPMTGNPSGFLTAHQSLNGYATEQWVEDKGYLTGIDIPESANWNSTYNTVHDNSASWTGGSTPNPQIPVTGINGIKISESGDQVVFEVSGDYYTNDNPSGFITGVPADMATTGDIADLAQSISETYQPIGDYQTAGDYYSASNPSGFITGVDLSDYATTAELADKQDITGMTAYQPVGNYQTAGDYLTTADSGNFYTTANESGFITGVDLTPYQLTADMVNYQTTAGMTAYLTAVPDTYLQNTDLSTEDGKVTAISGIPLSAGGDVPEGVMVESALEYNAVNEISAYNGSAIAQYGAEKQWLVHDDTLVHAANSAQYALGVNLSAVAQLLGVDETVLWSGSVNTNNGYLFNLPEPITNFKTVKVYAADLFGWTESIFEFDPSFIGTENRWSHCLDLTFNTRGALVTTGTMYIRGIMLTANEASVNSATQISAYGYENNSTGNCSIQKIIGIGRKS